MPDPGFLVGVCTLLGASVGAGSAIITQIYAQKSTSRRERQGQLRKSYTSFARYAFEYLDLYLENEQLQNAVVAEIYAQPGDADQLEDALADTSMTLDGSYAALRRSRGELNKARCQVLLLEHDGVFRARTNHAFDRLNSYMTFRVGEDAERSFAQSDGRTKHSTLTRDVTELVLALSERSDLRG